MQKRDDDLGKALDPEVDVKERVDARNTFGTKTKKEKWVRMPTNKIPRRKKKK